ncbi:MULTISPECIES: hypothetical protein [Pseudomonas]|uniref:Uncharacterized protein n=1 Tax=Pseudomonas putida TaxID=303 RepID=A0A379KZ82_PSEPU|nr:MULTISPECIES: hypothetical protein [Pseudomonas]AJG13513.1 hypothetical protein RK21_02005 [Pseudomonas plecoglossicida]KAF0252193.1 hypothetical protein GN299_24740 [Pseudomonas putida]MDD1984510.1 hypothetical protein [Pseudomonas asiatica]SUD78563.1 Uncharacterised protein [Pseudomonas putida]
MNDGKLGSSWFHLSVVMVGEGNGHEFKLMINDELNLLQVLQAQDNEVYVRGIQVVTPANMNGSGTWQMEKVAKLAIGDDQDRDAVCVISVEDGAVYHDSYRSNLDVASLTNMRVLYDALSAERSLQ